MAEGVDVVGSGEAGLSGIVASPIKYNVPADGTSAVNYCVEAAVGTSPVKNEAGSTGASLMKNDGGAAVASPVKNDVDAGGPSSRKSVVKMEILSVEDMEAKNHEVASSSKPGPFKKNSKVLNVKRKIVKRIIKKAVGSAVTPSLSKPSVEPAGEAEDRLEPVNKQITLGKSILEAEISPGKNNMEVQVKVEASSSKPETSKMVKKRVIKKTGGSAVTPSLSKPSVEPTGEAENRLEPVNKQTTLGKSILEAEISPGKNNMEVQVKVESSSSKPETSKIVKKMIKKKAGVSAVTLSKSTPSEEPAREADNFLEPVNKQIILGKNILEAEISSGKNMEVQVQVDAASSKPEPSKKDTPKVLKAKPKIVKRSLANESLNVKVDNGNPKVSRRTRWRKNKNLSLTEVTTENKGILEVKNKEHINGSDKGPLNPGSGEIAAASVGKNSRRQKNREKEKLGGMIFMCSAKTKPDCFKYHVMGVSMGKKDLVLSIKPGLKLFLYDFDLKLLYGVYKASSPGALEIEPSAFKGAFPAQVRFSVQKDCPPLHESVFKKAIKDNYTDNRKFKTELSVRQVRELSELFRSLPGGSKPAVSTSGDRDRGRVRIRESRPHLRGERGGKDLHPNDNSRQYHDLPRGRHKHDNAYKEEVVLRRRDESSRNMYLSEKEYRASGLQGDRRNPTPQQYVVHSPRRVALVSDPYQRDHHYVKDPLIRQARDVTYGVQRESNHADPLYMTEKVYQAYGLGGKLNMPAAAPSVTPIGVVSDHYVREPYDPYYYGASSDPYRQPAVAVQREVVSTVPRMEMDLLHRREPEIALRREVVSTMPRMEMDHLHRREHEMALRREVVSTVPRIEMDHLYRREPETTLRRDVTSAVPRMEMDQLHHREVEQVDRLYPNYVTDAHSNYNFVLSRHQGAQPAEMPPGPVSSRYSFAGPSFSYL